MNDDMILKKLSKINDVHSIFEKNWFGCYNLFLSEWIVVYFRFRIHMMKISECFALFI